MTPDWQEILRKKWGITAELTQLPGEFDLNFMVQTNVDDGYVLKVMRAGCDPDLVDMQIAALVHIAERTPQLPFPKVIPNLTGEQMVIHSAPSGEVRLVWLLERLPGRAFAQALPKTLDLIRDLGGAIGASDLALVDFTHPALTRDFKWNLMQAHWNEPKISEILTSPRRKLFDQIVKEYQAIMADLKNLPVQAIHNDVNDYNILKIRPPLTI